MNEPAYSPKGVAFNPTFECPGMCPHCNIPFDKIDIKTRLPIETGLRILREAKTCGVNAFQVTGGEPTLYTEFFLEIFKAGRHAAMKCHRPPTNCWLAADETALTDFFEQLATAGYTAGFRISLDRFHGRIPVEHTALFISRAAQFFSLKPFVIGCCDIDTGRSLKKVEKLVALLNENGLESSFDGKRITTSAGTMKTGFWAPTRPTWKKLPDSEFEFRTVNPEAGPEEQLKREAPIGRFGCVGPLGVGYLWTTPDGTVRACCGNAVNYIAALIIGNVHENSIEEILKTAANSRLLKTLAKGGPVEVAIRTGADKKHLQEKKYTHRCELCHHLLNDPEVIKKIS